MGFWQSGLLLGGLALSITLFGIIYGVVLGSVNNDKNQNVVKNFNTIFIVTSIILVILATLSYYYVKSDPSVFQPYTIVVLHLSLFISVLSVSFSSLKLIS